MSDKLRDAIRAKIAAKVREQFAAKDPYPGKVNPLKGMPWDFEEEIDWSDLVPVEAPLYNCPGQRVQVQAPGWSETEGPGCGLFLSRRMDTGETCVLLAARIEGEGRPDALWVFANDERDDAKRLLTETAKFSVLAKALSDNPKAEAEFVRKLGLH